ncbi:MAG TPA: hypothetical protein VM841_06415 [Actinomycetota bacterium]|nr:hypothetical protein [Actinomycetota bacterium]
MNRPRLSLAAYPAAFVVGAILGTFWDRLHVVAGTLVYADEGVFGQPFWIPLEFGAAAVAGVMVFTLLGDPAPRRESPRVAAIETLWISAVYAATAFFDRWPWALAALLLILLAVRAKDLAPIVAGSPIPSLALLLGGPLFEAALISSGVYSYRNSQLGPLPVWLPVLWAHGVLFMMRFSEAMLLRFGVRRRIQPATATLTPTDPEPDPEPDPIED